MTATLPSPAGTPAGTAPLLEVEDLHVEFRTREGIARAVNGVSYTLHAGRDPRRAGGVRLRQVRDRPGDHGHPRHPARLRHRGRGALPRPGPADDDGGRAAHLPGPARRDDLPGRAELAEPGVLRRLADRRDVPRAPRDEPQGRQGAGDRADGPGAHPGGQGAGQRLPAPVLRRHAPAHHDRDGDRAGPRRADRRRAHHRARRDRAGAGDGPARGAAARVRTWA